MGVYTIYQLSDPSDEYPAPAYVGWGKGEKPWTRRLENRVAKWVNDLGSPAAVKVLATMGTMREASRLAGWLIDRVARMAGGHPDWMLNNVKGSEKRRVYRQRGGKTKSWPSLLEANRETGRDRLFVRMLAESNGTDREGYTWWFE